MNQPASTPQPPYFAVIFTSVRSDVEPDEYAAMADRMVELAAEQPGYLGVESARGDDRLGITVSYWSDEESIRAWRGDAEHRVAQAYGRSRWYSSFALRIARVETCRVMEPR